MGAAVEIDIPAEAASPGGIVEAVASVEGHPVVYIAAVILTHQVGVGILGINAVNTGGGVHAGAHLAGHQIRGYQPLTVFVVPQMLGGEIDFNIIAAVGHIHNAVGQVGSVLALTDALLHAPLDILGKGLGVQFHAVIVHGHVQGAAAGGDEGFGFAGDIVSFL